MAVIATQANDGAILFQCKILIISSRYSDEIILRRWSCGSFTPRNNRAVFLQSHPVIDRIRVACGRDILTSCGNCNKVSAYRWFRLAIVVTSPNNNRTIFL